MRKSHQCKLGMAIKTSKTKSRVTGIWIGVQLALLVATAGCVQLKVVPAGKPPVEASADFNVCIDACISSEVVHLLVHWMNGTPEAEQLNPMHLSPEGQED